jgi:serine/threonine protein kinase
MPQDFWDEVQSVYAAVSEAPLGDRSGWLDERCAGRPDLRAEVESLLQSSDAAGTFLESEGTTGSGFAHLTAERFVGQEVAGFRLTEQIGQGGMGVVYGALRATGDFTHRVAVKLMDLPVRSDEALRRFRSERQILAALNHPHIVTFLDGGLTEQGYAFLVMEFVEGVPITRYCAERRLSLEDRLRLFQVVCGAVQHAHQHSVVHRDLKPGNILVTASGAPKMLDFGVAKLVATPDATADATTGSPFRALTPNYASPEQLRGLPVTTATDIYALGVLLYELVAGVRPYEMADKPLDQILKELLAGDFRRPSVSAASPGSQLPYAAHALRGDLDAIVMKAMRPDPAERYASAQELADDIGRYLSGAPVVAREPSFGYVIAHLARRHRAAFVTAAISGLAVVIALGVSLWQTQVARAERRRAEQRFADARQLANAVIFGIHDEVQKLPGSTAVRQKIVAEALTYLERLSQDPARDDAFTVELARAYYRVGAVQGSPSIPNLGDREGARTSFGKAIELLQPLASDPRNPHQAAHWLGDVQLSLASVAAALQRRDEAKAAIDAATALADTLVRRDPTDARARRLVANGYFQQAVQAQSDDRVAAWQRAGAAFEHFLREKPDDPNAQRNVALVEKYLGAAYESRAEYTEALPHHRRALELDERRLRADPSNRQAQFDVAIDLSSVAFNAWQTGGLTEAATWYERSVVMRRELAAQDPKDVLSQGRLAFAEMRLARVYSDLGRHAEALERAQSALAVSAALRRVDPSHEADYIANLDHFGRVLMTAGRRAEGCSTFRQVAALVAALGKAGVSAANEPRLAEVEGRLDQHARQCGSAGPAPTSVRREAP